MKIYNANGLAGCVFQRRSRETGTLVGLYRSEQAGLDDEAGAWTVVCEAHAMTLAVATLAAGRSHAAAPLGWCEACAEENDGD